MRAMLLLAAAAAFAAALEAGAANGVYLSSTTADAAACARLCADDGLCIAWSYEQEGACELRATAPSEPSGAAYGWSQRAPEALRRASIAAPGPAEPASTGEGSTPAEDEVSRLLLGGLEEDATGLRN